MSWENTNGLRSKSYVCGTCGKEVASEKGWYSGNHQFIYICHFCTAPTYFAANGDQIPGTPSGKMVANLPEDILEVYREIRSSTQNGNYTAALLLGRKLIMHLAVSVAGGKEGQKFVEYVDLLKSSGYTPKTAGRLLTQIKDSGNEKNHEIKLGDSDEAKLMVRFVESLLYFIYELDPAEEKPDKIP
ncbi:MAG: hypothetical protein WD157_01055 [Patescibacteria group bacterium]